MKILISHSWKDKSLAANIYECLLKDGHEVWHDIHQLIPGDNIQSVIDVYIKKCEVMILLWSLNAFESEGVEKEILSAKRSNKRIIPLQLDSTPLKHNRDLEGILGIPMDDLETGILLLQRGLLMLMASDNFKEAAWFKESFGNVVDLGGYLNYVNTFRLKGKKNSDGYKKEWLKRLEDLKEKNEYIRRQIMPAAQDKMQMLQSIMQKMEHGNVTSGQLEEWKLWCIDNQSFHPELLKKLKEFIENDILRLNKGGKPVNSINFESVEKSIERIDSAIGQKKGSAYADLFSKIKKYGGLFMSEKVIKSIVDGYLKYVVTCPQLLKELLNEARLSEYVAVKDTVFLLVQFLESQDHGLEMRKNNLDGFFDDSYIINNTVQLLIEADLVAKNNFSLDFISVNVVNKYVSFILNKHTKSRLDTLLQQIRDSIGVIKREINWSQVASVVIGAAAISQGIPYAGEIQGLFPGQENQTAETGNESNSPFFEDRVAAMSAKYGLGLNMYNG